jgi:aldehyde dehydrogenase (NAD+)
MSINVGGVTVKTGLFVDGEWVKGNGEKLETINPATEELLGTVSWNSHLTP